MAQKTYTQMWEEQKKKNPFLTLSNASTAAKPTTTTGSGANTVSGASANLGAGKATGGVSKPITANSGNKSSGNKSSGRTAAEIYTALLNNPPIVSPKVTYVTPTATPAKTVNTVAQDIATEAYKKRLAANQRRTTNQGMYNDEERNVNAPVSTGASDTFGYAMTPGNGYKTYAQQKAEAEAAAKEEADRLAYQQWIAQQQKLAEQKAMEEELLEEEEWEEEELDPMESYLQAILDAQNAQSQALINALMGQSGSLNAQYDANAANMYEMYRRGQLAFPELMSGTATGLADSFSLQNNLNFQNNLSDNELARAAALDALQVQANQVQADAELQAAQTAADWAKMMYQQRLANQNKGSSGKGSGTKKDEDDGYVANTIPEVKQYLELQLGMGNNMTYDNIISILKDMYNAGAISKSLAVDAAAQYGITLYL